MIQVQIEGTKIIDELSFHNLIAQRLHFPNYYGKNLDAFDECFSEFLISNSDEEILIEWMNFEDSKNNIGKERFSKILTIIDECKAKWKPDLKIKLC